MAINLAKKYQKEIDQEYALESLTKSAFGAKFDFIGVKTAIVYNLVSQALTDYTRTGSDRYGTPAELQDTTAEYAITQDKSFAITVDKGNYIQGNLVKTTGKVTQIQLNEQFIPLADTYNLSLLAATATSASQVATAAVTKANAYEKFLDGNGTLDDEKVPSKGRIAFVTPTFYNYIKLDGTFMLASELSKKSLVNGQVGEIDGVKIVKVPSSYFPANTSFIITHPGANANPMQIETIKTHEDPPGISGALIEGRFVFDAFTFANKLKSCYMHKIA